MTFSNNDINHQITG